MVRLLSPVRSGVALARLWIHPALEPLGETRFVLQSDKSRSEIDVLEKGSLPSGTTLVLMFAEPAPAEAAVEATEVAVETAEAAQPEIEAVVAAAVEAPVAAAAVEEEAAKVAEAHDRVELEVGLQPQGKGAEAAASEARDETPPPLATPHGLFVSYTSWPAGLPPFVSHVNWPPRRADAQTTQSIE